MNALRLTGLSLCLVTELAGFAQETPADSALQLKEITVTGSRLENFSAGTKIQTIDSASFRQYRSASLTNLLENESPLFIKSYGLGSLATSSFRGGNAAHTAILWNGFNLNSPMNGQVDLSLVPNNFINKVSIQYGGSSTLWGSGAVGGTIHLNSNPEFGKGITVSAEASLGSYMTYGQNVQAEISRSRWISSIKLFNASAKNNFEFHNTQLPGSPKVKQSNAELQQSGLLAENYFRINTLQKINVRFWYQHNDRNIPPIMLQTINRSNQQDESYRITSEWQRSGAKTTCMARIAYFDESLVYSDYAYDYRAFNRSQTVIAEGEAKIRLHRNHFLNTGVNNTFARATADGYDGNPQQNRFALFASYRFNSKTDQFRATLSARQEITSNTLVPFTYAAGSEWILSKGFSIKGNVSKVYRLPTFNDLYWNPGGNVNLLPESGYCEEAGVLIKPIPAGRKINFSFEPTVFNRNMDNWILWLPGQSYWSPQNIMKVWSRGMETRSELGILLTGKFKLRLSLVTNYVVSTNEKGKTENDASLGKQLIYVPMYSGFGKITVDYREFSLSWNQKYTGYRYTSTDNSEYLEPYWLSALHASYKISFNKYNVTLFAQVNNLFNEQYQVLLNRAMPLRNYQAGVSFQFNKPNNNN